MTVIVFLIVLAILVFVHELGHFLVAKAFGIRVDEFGLGFPPRLLSFTRRETRYSLNAIPFGGFVKIFGENPDEESLTGPDSPRSLVNKSKWVQAAVLFAGVFFNIVFAWLIISGGLMSGLRLSADNVPANAIVIEAPRVIVTSVAPDSPADTVGLKTADALLFLTANNEGLQNFSVEQIQDFIVRHGEEEITFLIRRGTENLTLYITPIQGIVSDRPAIGISMDAVGTFKLPFFSALIEGAKFTASLLKAITVGLGTFIYSAITGQADLSQVTGPVGIAGMVGEASRLGFVYLLSFTAFISLNLAVINLIPIPALDGGRLLFVLIESIKGSPIKPKVANTLNAIGFALLLLLMLVVTYQDIFRIVAR